MQDSPGRGGANEGRSQDAKSWNSLGEGGFGVGMDAQGVLGNDESANSQKFLGEFSGN